MLGRKDIISSAAYRWSGKHKFVTVGEKAQVEILSLKNILFDRMFYFVSQAKSLKSRSVHFIVRGRSSGVSAATQYGVSVRA